MRVAKVKDYYSPKEFKELFTTYKNDAIVYNRLVFLRSVKNSNSIRIRLNF